MRENIKIILVLVISLIIPFNTVYAKWACYFVVYNKNTYVITDKKVNAESIGSMLGWVTRYSDWEGTYSGNFSNKYPMGTKYYKIIGSDVNKVIAVKEKNGTFIEAQYEGEYAGGRYDIRYFLLNFSGILLVCLLVKKKIQKL